MNRHARALATSAVAIAACFLGTSTATAQLPEEGRKALAYYVGDWTYTFDKAGAKYSGTWSVKWSQDESCLLSNFATKGPNGHENGTKMTGWDSAKSQTVDLSCSDNGAHTLSRYKVESEQVSLGERIGSTAEGKASRSDARVVREKNKFTWTISNLVENGVKQPDLVFVFQRVADK